MANGASDTLGNFTETIIISGKMEQAQILLNSRQIRLRLAVTMFTNGTSAEIIELKTRRSPFSTVPAQTLCMSISRSMVQGGISWDGFLLFPMRPCASRI